QHAFDATEAIDPDHLFVIIEAPRGAATELAPFSAVCTGHGVDVYPVSFGVADPDLSQVGKWTRTIRSVTPGRAVFTTLQICFSGSDDPAGSDAIINGARGLIFFGGATPHCLFPADAALGWNWTFWDDVLRRLVAEIGPRGRLHPALLAPDTGPALRTDDPTTEIESRSVGEGDIWVMAARSGSGTRKVTIRGLPAAITKGRHYRSNRPVTVRRG